jgi:beta-1,4-mannosyl-glycoprotein beta-1,4-N-acetylglucosaminyltransferase
MSTRVIDAVLFNNEYSLLQRRIIYFKDLVDVHVILESNHTFSGKFKNTMSLEKYQELKTLTGARIILLKLDDLNITKSQYENRWEVEEISRFQLFNFLINTFQKDRIVFADIDEFPSREQILRLKELQDNSVYSIYTPTYYQKVNWKLVETHKWLSVKTFLGSNPPDFCDIRNSEKFQVLDGEGSHLSYLGMTHKDVSTKFEDFSHKELMGYELLEEIIWSLQNTYAVDHIGRFFTRGFGLFKIVPNTDLPDINKFLYNFDPHLYLELDHGEASLVKRLIASALITKIRNFPESLDNRFLTDVRLFKISDFPKILIFKVLIYVLKSYLDIFFKKLLFKINFLVKQQTK